VLKTGEHSQFFMCHYMISSPIAFNSVALASPLPMHLPLSWCHHVPNIIHWYMVFLALFFWICSPSWSMLWMPLFDFSVSCTCASCTYAGQKTWNYMSKGTGKGLLLQTLYLCVTNQCICTEYYKWREIWKSMDWSVTKLGQKCGELWVQNS
jgi:hypothetical protein